MTNTTEPKVLRDMKVPCFLIGIGAGVALTLLLAPASGASTRRFITRNARNVHDWAQDQTEHVSNTVDALHDQAEDVARRVGLT